VRILAIRGHNLASLARTFEVDLAAGPLRGTGLFAIPGAAGARITSICG
jgi:exonuclease SbcC